MSDFNNMVNKEEIIKLSKLMPNKMVGIYFLIKNDEIVYVGQTARGLYRIVDHLVDKDFDRYYFIPINNNLDEIESNYIMKFNPKYNNTISYKAYVSIGNASKKLRNLNLNSDKRKVKKYIEILNIKKYFFKNSLYIKETDILKIQNYMESKNEIHN